MLDAEALLLVDDQQAQILKFHVLLEEAVGADEQIDAPLLQPPQGVLHLGLGAEAADHVDLHRGGRFTAYYNDDDMFWGHSVEVSGSLKKGITYANLAG